MLKSTQTKALILPATDKYPFLCNAIMLVMIVWLSLFVTTINAANNPRIESVEKLLFSSSAARQIMKSESNEAQKKYAYAKRLYDEAVSQDRAGQLDESNTTLDQATRVMIEATQMTDKKSFIIEKDRRDYDNRIESVNALMRSFDNISNEKGSTADDIEKLHAYVDDRLSRADAFTSRAELKQARKLADEAYVAAKIAIENLRNGETLVRSLKFNSKEEEYLYEVDRNDTHQMLIQILLNDKIKAGTMGERVYQYIDSAKVLRLDADRLAGDGDYESAILVMEKSTKEIVRAIRSAGVFIPG